MQIIKTNDGYLYIPITAADEREMRKKFFSWKEKQITHNIGEAVYYSSYNDDDIPLMTSNEGARKIIRIKNRKMMELCVFFGYDSFPFETVINDESLLQNCAEIIKHRTESMPCDFIDGIKMFMWEMSVSRHEFSEAANFLSDGNPFKQWCRNYTINNIHNFKRSGFISSDEFEKIVSIIEEND